jgi:hypothetical protein
MQNKIYQTLKKQIDFMQIMKNIPNFSELKSELYKEDIYKTMKTLCFDIENVFIRKVDLKDFEELQTLKNTENFGSNYVLIDRSVEIDESEEQVSNKTKME